MKGLLGVLGFAMLAVNAGAAPTPDANPLPPAWTYDFWISSEGTTNAKAAGEAGFQANQFRLMDYFFVRYLSDRGTAYDPRLKGRDYTKDIMAQCKTYGMRPMGYLIPYRSQDADIHTDWRMLDFNGNPVDDHGPCLDWMSPWGDELIARLLEVNRKYGLQGFWFDGLMYQYHGGAKGKYAAERYKKDTGRDLPAKWDLKDENCRHWLAWRGEVLADYVVKIKRALRKQDPNAAIFANALRYMMWPSWQAWGYEALERAVDMPCAEYSWYLGNDPVHKRFFYARLRGVQGDKPAASWIVPGMDGAGPRIPPAPLAETYSRIYTCLTQRIAIGMWPDVLPSRHVKDIVNNVKIRAPFLKRAKDVHWAALVVTERDDWFFDLTERAFPYRHNYEGIYRMLCEMHVPVDVLTERDINAKTLGQYAVVILPGQHCMSATAVEAIKAYVNGGGGLVATDMTSRWDEWANVRKDFALADVFGCSYVGVGSVDEKGEKNRLLEVNVANPVLAGDRVADTLVSQSFGKGAEGSFINDAIVDDVKKPITDKNIMSMYTCPGRILATKPVNGGTPVAWLVDEQLKRTTPALYTHQFGKGRVVYSPMDLGSMYAVTSYPQWRIIVDQACRYVAKQGPCMDADAPLDVQFEPTYQPAEKRYVLHLLNDHLQSLAFMGQERRVRQDLPLIAGVKINVRNIPVTEAYAEPGHRKLTVHRQGENSVIEIPPLADHMMVVFAGNGGGV